MKDVTREIPAHLWTTTLVAEAFEEVIEYRAVLTHLKRIGAISNAKTKPMKVNPTVLRDHTPSIYHRCVQIVLEQRMAKQR